MTEKEDYFRGLYALRDESDEDDIDTSHPAPAEVVEIKEKAASAFPVQKTILNPVATVPAAPTSETTRHNLTISGAQMSAVVHVAPNLDAPLVLNTDAPSKLLISLESSVSASSREPSDDSGNETDEPPLKKVKKVKGIFHRGQLLQDNFQCMKGGSVDDNQTGPNDTVIELLKEMLAVRERGADKNDHWRAISYQKIISTLRKQETAITTYEQAIALPGVGDSLAQKIVEAAATGRLRHLENALNDPSDAIMKLFRNIYGVGPEQAAKWKMQGYKTLQDLLDHAHLTTNQRMGIEHYEDLQTKIPREEVTALGAIVQEAAAKIDPKVQCIIGGSYRRGAPESGDIDFLITKPGTTQAREILPFLNALTSHLTSTKFLVSALAVPKSHTGRKWHGCCVLPTSRIWRRIDFLLVPESEIGAALIYFTGNEVFNRSLRLLANKKGMNLNEKGLSRDVLRGKNRVKIADGTIVESADERRIFEILGVPWREPEDRIC